MKELGEYLKQTRIANGVSLEEAAEDLQLTTLELENMESGNIRAFQDVYNLKEQVKTYSKYLGLDPDKVLDEFNDFLFEHTSKISLTDILEAEQNLKNKEKTTNDKKITSPYTKISNKNIILPWEKILFGVFLFLLVMLLIYIIFRNVGQPPKIATELKANIISEVKLNEYAY